MAEIKFIPKCNIFWGYWGRPSQVFNKVEVYEGELIENGKVLVESPYWDFSDYVDKDQIEIIS